MMKILAILLLSSAVPIVLAQTYFGGSAHVGNTGANVLVTASAPDLSSNFVAWWGLEESGDNDRVASGGTCGADCTLVKAGSAGGVGTLTGVEGTNGYDRTAIVSSDSKIRCTIATCNELFPGVSDNFSYGCWINPDDATPGTAGNPLLAGTTGGSYFMQNTAGGEIACSINSAMTATSTSSGLADATWTHAACVYTDATPGIATYINAVANGTATGTAFTVPSATDFELGQGPGNGGGFVGGSDECFVAFRVLTAPQLCHIASCGILGGSGPCLCGDDGSYVTDGRHTTRSLACTLPTDGCLTGGF